MIKILDDTKTLAQLVADTSNGLGHLDPLRCTVTEELNGIFEAELEVLHNDRHFSDLHVGGILKMPVNDTDYDQLFRIYYISKEISQTCVVKCEHISYDLSKVPVEPFSATGASLACSGLVSHSMVTNPFTMSTDITNTTSTFTLDVPRSFRECLGGYEGSMLDTFRGEYKWDNLTVNYLARRGADNGVRISYGKNLTDFQQETNNAEVYTGVLGFATVDDVCYVGNVYNKTTGNKIKIVDFSSDYESGQTPTTAELTTKAQTYATNNDIEIPSVNIKISFVPLYQTEEYKNIAPLERVSLGDTVHVYFEKLGVEASSRVVKTVWNVLLNKYDSVELGSTKANLNTVINDSIADATSGILDNIDIDTGAIENELSVISQLIVNGMGLHITKDSQGRIYLHNEETLVNSQYQYMITSNGFMLSDDYGQTWNSGWDIQGNAVMNSLATIVLNALEVHGAVIQGSQIVFGDTTDKYIVAQPYYDANNDPLGVSFDGTGYVRFQPQSSFIVDNLDSNSVVLNEFVMDGSSTLNKIELLNYCLSYPSNRANRIYMRADATYNSIGLTNYKNGSTEKTANQVYMSHTSTNSSLSLYNYHYENGTSMIVNQLGFSSMGSGVDIGSMVSLVNYKYDSGSTQAVNSLVMKSDMSTQLWSKNDMRVRSSGAVRIYANLDSNSSTGDYNTNPNGGQQDTYVGGYSLKLQAQSGGRIYLYWGSTRYYLGVSNGVVTATAA